MGSKLVAPHMVERKHGRIIHIASIQGFASSGEVGSYNAAKGGILAITKSMAVELGPHNILVNSVAPGFTLTPMSIVNGVNETETPDFLECQGAPEHCSVTRRRLWRGSRLPPEEPRNFADGVNAGIDTQPRAPGSTTCRIPLQAAMDCEPDATKATAAAEREMSLIEVVLGRAAGRDRIPPGRLGEGLRDSGILGRGSRCRWRPDGGASRARRPYRRGAGRSLFGGRRR